jgi:transcriptional regulator with XRE-family HTH domain
MEEKSKRNMDIVAMFSCGMRKSEIARRVGISVGRVSQILKSEARKAAPKDIEDIYSALGCRAGNTLKSAGYYTREDILKAMADGTFFPNRIKNLGKKTLDDVMRWVGIEPKKKAVKTCPHCGGEL